MSQPRSKPVGNNVHFQAPTKTYITVSPTLWSVLSGVAFYGLSYYFFVLGGTRFSVLTFLLLMLAGAIVGVVTFWGSTWLKARLLEHEDVDKNAIIGSITIGRVAFLLLVPVVAVVGFLHFGLGLYLVGLALVAQKLIEGISLSMVRGIPIATSLIASFVVAIFWFIPLLFFV